MTQGGGRTGVVKRHSGREKLLCHALKVSRKVRSTHRVATDLSSLSQNESQFAFMLHDEKARSVGSCSSTPAYSLTDACMHCLHPC